MPFLYATLSGPENVPARHASELLGIARQLPRWDALIIAAENEQYPRLHITWHEDHGFVVHCFEDGDSWGFFLATTTSFTSPEIEIEMGGQALEKWPRQLFVDSDRALEALDFFLETGKQNETQHYLTWLKNASSAFASRVTPGWFGRRGYLADHFEILSAAATKALAH